MKNEIKKDLIGQTFLGNWGKREKGWGVGVGARIGGTFSLLTCLGLWWDIFFCSVLIFLFCNDVFFLCFFFSSLFVFLSSCSVFISSLFVFLSFCSSAYLLYFLFFSSYSVLMSSLFVVFFFFFLVLYPFLFSHYLNGEIKIGVNVNKSSILYTSVWKCVKERKSNERRQNVAVYIYVSSENIFHEDKSNFKINNQKGVF